MKIGIIGGTGLMGTLFTRVFAMAGHEVQVSGRKTPISNTTLARISDLIIISVPIHSTVPVVEEISPYLTNQQLICDLTSLKVKPVAAMMQTAANVIGLHPMFGPTVSSLQGQTIIMTPERCSEEQRMMLTRLFKDQGARITVTTPEYHDQMMAVIQGLTHFKALVMAETMRRLGITPEDTEPFMSPVYRIETSIAGRILAQDPLLYADILMENPEIPHILESCCASAASLADIITGKNNDAFVDHFLSDKRWFGEYCARSLEETDRIINSMVKI